MRVSTKFETITVNVRVFSFKFLLDSFLIFLSDFNCKHSEIKSVAQMKLIMGEDSS